MEEVEYYCDKCESTNVEMRIVEPEKTKVRKPMSQCRHPDSPKTINAVYTINEWEMVCNDCGHSVKLIPDHYVLNGSMPLTTNTYPYPLMETPMPLMKTPMPDPNSTGNPPPQMLL